MCASVLSYVGLKLHSSLKGRCCQCVCRGFKLLMPVPLLSWSSCVGLHYHKKKTLSVCVTSATVPLRVWQESAEVTLRVDELIQLKHTYITTAVCLCPYDKRENIGSCLHLHPGVIRIPFMLPTQEIRSPN